MHKRILLGSLILSIASLPFSVKLCHLGIIIIVANWLFEGDWKTKRSVFNRSVLLQLIVGYVFLDLLGLLFTDDLRAGWFSFEKKIFLLLLPICLATTSIKLQPKEVKSVLLVFVMACLAGTVYCIFHAWQEAQLVLHGEQTANPYLSGSQYFTLHPEASDRWIVFSYVSLADGINIHPTYFSVFLAFCACFLLQEFSALGSRIQKAAVLLFIIYLSAFTIFLASRIVIFSIVGMLIVIIIKSVTKRQYSVSLIASAFAVLCISLFVLNPVIRYRSLEEIRTSTFEVQPGNNYTTSTQIRYSLWWLAVESLKEWNPVTGYGTGEPQQAIAKTASSLHVTNSLKSSDPHNQFLYTLLAHGVPGLLVLVLLLALPLYWSWSQKSFLLVSFSLLFCLLCVTESALELQKGIIFYSLFAGLLYFQLYSFQALGINVKYLLRAGQ